MGEGDCSRLAVTVSQVGQRDLTPGSVVSDFSSSAIPKMVGGLQLVSFAISIFRCHKISEADDLPASVLDANAEPLLRDVWALSQALMDGHRRGALFERCNEVWFDAAIPVVASGGVAGWRFQLRVQFDADVTYPMP